MTSWPNLGSAVDREIIVVAREISRHAMASAIRNSHGALGPLLQSIDPTAKTAAAAAGHILTGKRPPADRAAALASLKRLLDSMRMLGLGPREWTRAEAAAVADIVKGMIRRRGVAQLREVIARAGNRPAVVSAMLAARQDFSWLDEAAGWFWLRSVGRNPLLSQIRKVLSVSPRLAVPDLRAAVVRGKLLNGSAPPARVLEAFCGQLDWCTVQRSVVVAHPAPDWIETLSPAEADIAGVLIEFGPVMQRRELHRRCLEAGMAESTYLRCMAESPVVWRYARGVCGFPGVDLSPACLNSLLPKAPKTRVLKDHGWTAEGQIWLRYRLTEAAILSGSVSVPASLDRMLPRRAALADGAKVRLCKSQIFGLRKLLRKFQPGDEVTLVLQGRD